jgi:hypothetical protein
LAPVCGDQEITPGFAAASHKKALRQEGVAMAALGCFQFSPRRTLVSSSLAAAIAFAASGICATSAADEGGCHLQSAPGAIKHIVHIQFDNVHFRRDNPYVPSDLEQMPNLLNFLEQNGTLLTNHHTPLISHTADDIITTLTGVYGEKHGQPVANSYGYFRADGSVGFASSFAYWTDTAPDGKPQMIGAKSDCRRPTAAELAAVRLTRGNVF